MRKSIQALTTFPSPKTLSVLAAALVFTTFAHAQLTTNISTVAGNGSLGFSGDGGAATLAKMFNPTGVALDPTVTGNYYIADSINNRIRLVTASTGKISTVAGSATGGFAGDGGAATSAELSDPTAVAVDSSGNLYIADTGNQRIRKVTKTTGFITTIAGNGTSGYSGDGGLPTSAKLNYPQGIAVDTTGNIYIADTSNSRVRWIPKSSGDIYTLAGTGTAGYSGNGGAGASAQVSIPTGVAVDGSGNLFIADTGNGSIRQVIVSTDIISTVVGQGLNGFSGDGGVGTSAKLSSPQAVAVDSTGNLYIADSSNYRIRKWTKSSKIITTVAGNGTNGFSGDGGAATSAEMNTPLGIAVDSTFHYYIADTYNQRIREVGK
ncbi:sugar lactone lactonase YvrE [Granulicella aggregans]|uniref:Sugar lactone lactonase YvrE n=1 Tax=Granulicella aggregans TaxID=474949 RepID=A0A7W8E6N9_9BACT|nr:NHL repeat-containing protein [Granulicella aggregans]MBB5061413.1 sugar lactone lactonase YvrE [Granulicella aggregans]